MSESIQGASTPFALALLVCDSVVVDERSKKKTLVGIFDTVYVAQFPTQHYPVVLYARLTDAEGQYAFRLEYVRVETDELLMSTDIPPVNLPDRLKIHELVFEPPPIPLTAPGEYEFRLWANSRYIGRAKFLAASAKR